MVLGFLIPVVALALIDTDRNYDERRGREYLKEQQRFVLSPLGVFFQPVSLFLVPIFIASPQVLLLRSGRKLCCFFLP
jgi:hypothetical protein